MQPLVKTNEDEKQKEGNDEEEKPKQKKSKRNDMKVRIFSAQHTSDAKVSEVKKMPHKQWEIRMAQNCINKKNNLAEKIL